MQTINAILGSELKIDAELTEDQMALLCGGDDEDEDQEAPEGEEEFGGYE